MYYELYIDILFLVNFMMDSLLLFTLRRLLKRRVGNGRIFLGGAAGAGLACLAAVIPAPGWIKIPVSYVGIGGAMLCIGLKIRRGRELLRAFAFLYAAAFILGGMMQALRPYVRTGSLFFAAAVVSYFLLNGCWKLLARQRNVQAGIYRVTLYTNRGEYCVNALADTGNMLRDSVTGEPVSVLGKSAARQIWDGVPPETGDAAEYEGFRYLPYRTVSGSGVMPVVRIRKMCIHMQKNFWREKPLIGIGSGELAEQEEYQMILNSDILGGMEHGSKSSGTAAV